ncbi:HlyD family secretion protein [Chloroflexota bacterium]
MEKKQIKLALLLTLISLILLGSTACSNKADELQPAPVEVSPGDTVPSVTGDGNLSLPRKRELTFDSSGTIKVLNVEEGDRVEEGQLLAQLDTSSFERAVAKAERQLESAQTNLDKLQNPPNLAADTREAEADVESAKARLAYVEIIFVQEGQYPEGLNKRSLVEEAKAALGKAEERLVDLRDGPDERDVRLAENEIALAELSLDEAKKQLEEATIFAPFDGIVAEVNFKLGDRTMAATNYQTVIYLIDSSQMQLKVEVDEIDIPGVKLGQSAVISIEALPDVRLEGEVLFVSPLATKKAGVVMYEVKISFDVPEGYALREGMSASAEIIVT